MGVRFSFAKEIIVYVLSLLLGLILVIGNLVNLVKWYTFDDFETVARRGFKRGTYVVFDIDEYLYRTLDNGKFTGVSTTYIATSKDYDVYGIPVGDGYYVRVMIGEDETKGLLEGFVEGSGAPVTLRGKVVKNYDFAMEWYDQIDGFDASKIIPNVYIKEYTSNRSSLNWLSTGLLLLAFGAFKLWREVEGSEFKNWIAGFVKLVHER